MASQHRTLTPAQVERIEIIKKAETAFLQTLVAVLQDAETAADPRWVAIARTHVEEGAMAAVRAVTKPDAVEFPAPPRR